MTVNDALKREADAYLSASLYGSAWNDAVCHAQQKALTTAIRQLDIALRGVRVPEQTHKEAVFEQAAFLLDEDMQSAVKSRQKGISSVSIGHVSESYREDLQTEQNGIVLSPMTNALLQPFIGSRRIMHGRLIP